MAIDHLRRGQSVAAGGRVRFASLERPDGALTPEAAAVGDGLTPELLVTAGEALHDRRVLTGLLLEALPAGDKALLWWMEYGLRSYRELARWYATTVSAVKSRLLRARQRLDAFARIELARRGAGGGAVARFLEHADRTGGPGACWPWLGAVSRDTHSGARYARLCIGGHQGRMVPGRRVALVCAHGPIPPGVYPLTSCAAAEPADCVNPAHMVPGRKHGAGTGQAAGRYVPLSVADAYAPPPRASELARRRRALGLSQVRFADAAGLLRQTVAAAEMGRHREHIGRGQLAQIDAALTQLEGTRP